MKYVIKAIILATSLVITSCAEQGGEPPKSSGSSAEILWDQYGVPHIYAESKEAADYAFGRAQMENHTNLLLKLYGTSRGRAAEYWGEKYLASDVMVHRLGLPDRADALLEAQGAEYAARLEAFVQGMNDWAAENPAHVNENMKAVLPLSAQDVLRQVQYSIHVTFMAGRAQGIAQGWEAAEDEKPGSNGWAIAPSRSESGNAMLLMNPHLPWNDQFLFFEGHIKTPGYEAYGVSLIGMPNLAIAFNKDLGWTHTVNTYDGTDMYELTIVEGGYLFDGKTVPFEENNRTLKVRSEDGSLVDYPMTIRRSLHGPVISEKGNKALAIRVAGLEEPDHNRLFEQYWKLGSAINVDEFEAALAMHQMPMFNAIYADRHGDIFYAFNALQPVRKSGDVAFWSGVVDGTKSDLLWQGYRAYDELPRFRNPTSGFIQNANDAPWSSTIPMVLNPADFPADIAPLSMPMRPQNSATMLVEDTSISWDELMQYRQSTRAVLADRIWDDLVVATESSDDPIVAEAMAVLANWDRETLPNSRGALLFYNWVQELGVGNIYYQTFYTNKWSLEAPLSTPSGIADPAAAVAALAKAATAMKKVYGALDVPWGEFVRVRYAGQDHPASVGPGVMGAFRVGFLGRADDTGIVPVVGGNSFVAAVEFGDTIRAQGILGAGNTTEPQNESYGNQLELHEKGQFRDILFYRDDVEGGAKRRETVVFPQ
jgi:acyl-homoserine-lactone acylase